MTKQDIKQLELEVDELFSDALGTECIVETSPEGALRVRLGMNLIICVESNLENLDEVNWTGSYDDLKNYINKILLAIRSNSEKIKSLLKAHDVEFRRGNKWL